MKKSMGMKKAEMKVRVLQGGEVAGEHCALVLRQNVKKTMGPKVNAL